MINTKSLLSMIFFVIQFQDVWADESEINRVVKTEMEFAATAERAGVKQAFLAFLADDAVLFRPGPVRGKQWMQQQKESDEVLTWQISFAELASSEDLAYTMGPWQFREKKEDDPVQFGTFMTIWRKQPDDTWKAILDLGVSHPAPSVKVKGIEKISKETTASMRKSPPDVLKLDREFAEYAGTRGEWEAFHNFSSDRIRLLRDGRGLASGKESALKLIDERGKPSFETISGGASLAGDLVYVYGSRHNLQSNEIAQYLRIWNKESDSYRIILDVLSRARKKQ